jgi:chromosome segregation ATPase
MLQEKCGSWQVRSTALRSEKRVVEPLVARMRELEDEIERLEEERRGYERRLRELWVDNNLWIQDGEGGELKV